MNNMKEQIPSDLYNRIGIELLPKPISNVNIQHIYYNVRSV